MEIRELHAIDRIVPTCRALSNPDTVTGRMYRFLLRPKWIVFHLLVIGAVVLMVNLGFWQLRRLDERKDFNRDVSSRIEQVAVPLADLVPRGTGPDAGELADVEWRPVTFGGRYLTGEDVLAYNRSQGGIAGVDVLTPMELDDGRIVIVNRGFVPQAEVAAPAPDGDVMVTGRLRRSEGHRRGLATDEAEGELDEIRRIDVQRLAPQLPGDVVPMYVELTASDPAEVTPYPVVVEAPELGERNHLSYAVQWFIFSLCAIAGWVFAVRKSARTARSPTRRSRVSTDTGARPES
jgi:surfeit locus 1 family protein